MGWVAQNRALLLGAGLLLLPERTAAHAPVVRSASVGADSGVTVISVPGFGLLLGQADGRYAYACDAELGLAPSEAYVAVLHRADGTLVVGTGQGLRLRDGGGCALPAESASALRSVPVAALAETRSGRVYAVTAGELPALQRSDDGGVTFSVASFLPVGARVSELVLREADGLQAIVSYTAAGGEARLWTWDEAQGSGRELVRSDGLRVLHSGGGAPLWGLRRAPDGAVNRGFELVRADAVDGPWQSLLYVNYFGGFAVGSDGALWVGDAGGGVYRSRDGGAHFDNVAAGVGAACLVLRGSVPEVCVLSSPAKPSYARWDEASGQFEPVLTLSAVDQLVSCPGVDSVCAAAWREWRRDALLIPPEVDAGSALQEDAAAAPAADEAADAALPSEPAADDAGTPRDAPADRPVPEPARADTGCSAGPAGTGTHWLALLVPLCAGALARRRRRPA